MRSRTLHWTVCLGAALLVAGVATGQQATSKGDDSKKQEMPAEESAAVARADRGVIEEITVTARKTEESLEDVPLTIRAFTAAEMSEAGLANIDDIAMATPGIQISNYEGGRDDPGINFRGMDVGSSDRTAQGSSAFIDGIYLPGSIQFIGTEMIRQVEVVKGPQSAFFGRNTFGGAINIMTKQPTFDWTGDASLVLGANDRQDLGVNVAGPLSDQVAFHFFGRYYDYGGGYDNPVEGSERFGAQNTVASQASIEWAPSDNVTMRLRGFFSRDDDGPSGYWFYDSSVLNCGPFSQDGMTGTSMYYCGELGPDQVTDFGYDTHVDRSTPGANWPKNDFGLDRDFLLTSFNVDATIGDLKLTSISAYLVEKSDLMDNFANEGTLIQYYKRKDRLISQEFRLQGGGEKLSWMGGLYYLDAKYHTMESAFGCADPDYLAFGYAPGCPMFLYGPNVRGYFDIATDPAKKIRDIAAFGSVEWHINDVFTLSLEGRVTRETLDYGEIQAVDGNVNVLKDDFDSFTPRLILDYKPKDNSTFYFIVANGNKNGNFNSDMADMAASAIQAFEQQYGASISVPEETMMDYELGWKQVWGRGRHRLNAALFYMDWSDQQFYQFAQNFDTNGDGVVDSNDEFQIDYLTTAGKSEIKGAELFYSGWLSEIFNLSFAYNYNDATYVRFEDSAYAAVYGSPDAGGRTQPRSPKQKASIGALIEVPLKTADWSVYARGDYNYIGSTYTWAINQAETGAAKRLNLRLGAHNDTWDFSFWVNNATDDDTPFAIRRFSDFTNFRNAFWAGLPQPREAGVTLRMNFF